MNKTKIKVAILSCAITAMLYNTFIGVMVKAAEVTVGANYMEGMMDVGYLMTIPVLLAIPINIIIGLMTRYVRPKVLMTVCLLFAVAGGFPLFMTDDMFMHNVWILWFAAGLTGVATSMVTTLINTMITQNFEMKEQFGMMGMNNGFGSFGAVTLSLLGGLVVSVTDTFHLFYLPMFVGCLAILIIFVLLMPKGEKIPKPKKSVDKIPAEAWFYVTYLTLYMMASMSFLAPIALRMVMAPWGYQATSGTVTTLIPTVTLLGGAVLGLFTGKIASGLGKYTKAFGPFIAAIGYGLSMFAADDPAIGTIMLALGGFFVGSALSISLAAAIFGIVGCVPHSKSSFMMGLSTAIGNTVTFTFLTVFVWNMSGVSLFGLQLGMANIGSMALYTKTMTFFNSFSNAGNIAPVLFIAIIIALGLAISAFVKARMEIKKENNFDNSNFDF